MALVDVARFLDMTEAQVVASALRSSGMFVFVQNETMGQMDVNLLYAIGGVRLWVNEEDAADARAYIAASRKLPSQKAPLPVVEATTRTAASLLLTLLFGFIVPLRPRRPERLGDELAAD